MKKLELFNSIQTVLESRDFIESLQNLLESLYEVGGDMESKVNENIPIDKLRDIKSFFKENKLDIFNKNDLEKGIKSAIEYLKSLEEIDLTLAFSPTISMVNEIYGWFEQNLNNKVLLNFKIDKNLIGGAMINYNGKYKDYSLRNHLKV